MASVNQVTILGYLGRDPQVTTTPQGVKVARISIGTTEKGFTTKAGQQIPDRTEWHDVVLWRHNAEFAERFCRKGSQVFTQGKLRHRSYTDNDNQKRYVTEIEADEFMLLDRAAQNQPQGQQYSQDNRNAPAAQKVAQNEFSQNDNGGYELPF